MSPNKYSRELVNMKGSDVHSAGSSFLTREATAATFPERKRSRVIISALVTVFWAMTDIPTLLSRRVNKDKLAKNVCIISSLLAIVYARSCKAVPDIGEKKWQKIDKNINPLGWKGAIWIQQFWHNRIIFVLKGSYRLMISSLERKLMEGYLANMIWAQQNMNRHSQIWYLQCKNRWQMYSRVPWWLKMIMIKLN